MNTHELKNLQVRLTKLEAELEGIDAEISDLNERKNSMTQKMKTIEDDIKKAKKSVTVSEHAILRYFERVLGFNLDDNVSKSKISISHIFNWDYHYAQINLKS